MHDIGKFGVPDRILLKKGKLNRQEFDEIKSHVTIGHQTLIKARKKYPNNSFLNMGIEIARWHHEKWDGTGYPDGLSGTQIPLSARVMAIADVYDALRSKRPYKPAFTHEQSVEIIRDGSGTHFDPDIVTLFEKIEKKFAVIHNRQKNSQEEDSI
ncbi:HD-GYP domain-containing protein [Desulfonatronovibrio magnus]|uniref:HD-GYP domain-containing protein n=1 Tax=Desulfonatronovibrio magnus TaxID=698827 RepID=UPI0018DC9B5B|nr:HD domain-containing phosphohydrolase [Desulfonatronovibrio magnus]